MAIKITKTPTRLKWEILSIEQIDDNHIITIKVKEPDSMPCSIGGLRFYSEETSAWEDATLRPTVGQDYDNINLSPRYKEIPIHWDSPTDFRIQQEFTDINIEVTLYDEVSQGGTAESKTVYTNVDFTLPELSDKRIIKPKSNTEDMVFRFLTPITIRNSQLHFLLEIDTETTFNSGPMGQPEYSFFTEDDRTDWSLYNKSSLSWVPFPEDGVPVDPSGRGEEVKFNNATISGLNTGDYYFRIQPFPRQFFAIITLPVNGGVYTGNIITISGNITTLNAF